MKIIAIATVITLAVLSLAYALFFMPTRFRLESISPSGAIVVRGLRFEGTQPNDLDGTLRLYIGDYKRQTTIPWSDRLAITWTSDTLVEAFEVRERDSVLMLWRIEDGHVSCVEGNSYLASDPYIK